MSKLIAIAFLCLFSQVLSAQGSIILQKQFGGTGDEESENVIQTSDENFVVVARSTSSNFDVPQNFGFEDIYIFKVDENLDTIWTSILGGTQEDYSYDIIETSEGDLVLCAATYSNNLDAEGNAGMLDGLVAKLNANGDKLWTKVFGGSRNDELFTLVEVQDGYLLAGQTSSPEISEGIASDDSNAWLLKLDKDGEQQWSRTLGGSKDDRINSLSNSTNNNIIAAGQTRSEDGDLNSSNGYFDAWFMILNEQGELLLSKNYGGLAGDVAVDVDQLNDGSFGMLCETRSFDGDVIGNHGNEDYWFLKLDDQGEIIWQKSIGGSLQDNPRSFTETEMGAIVMIGTTLSNDFDVSIPFDNFNIFACSIDGQSGDFLWKRALGGSNTDFGISALPLSEDRFLLNGFTQSLDGDFGGKHGAHEIWLSIFQAGSFDNIAALPSTQWQVYPNPLKDITHIQSDENIETMQLLDHQGRVLESWHPNTRKTQIKIDAPKGNYWLSILTRSGLGYKQITIAN